MNRDIDKIISPELKKQLKATKNDRTAIARFDNGDYSFYLTGWNDNEDLPYGYILSMEGDQFVTFSYDDFYYGEEQPMVYDTSFDTPQPMIDIVRLDNLISYFSLTREPINEEERKNERLNLVDDDFMSDFEYTEQDFDTEPTEFIHNNEQDTEINR